VGGGCEALSVWDCKVSMRGFCNWLGEAYVTSCAQINVTHPRSSLAWYPCLSESWQSLTECPNAYQGMVNGTIKLTIFRMFRTETLNLYRVSYRPPSHSGVVFPKCRFDLVTYAFQLRKSDNPSSALSSAGGLGWWTLDSTVSSARPRILRPTTSKRSRVRLDFS
jgi:hypothetical protein